LNTMYSNSAKPSENIMMAIECAPQDQAQRLYYVRSGANPDGTDIRLYDMLSFQIATQNMPDDYTGMGQLWVSYDITLCKSVSNNQLGFDLNTDHFQLVAPAVAGPAYFGTSYTLKDHSNLGCTLDGGDGIIFPPTLGAGTFLISYSVTGASTALAAITLTLVNCIKLDMWNNNTFDQRVNAGSTFTQYLHQFVVRITNFGATIVFSSGTIPGTPTFGDLIITQINGEIYQDVS